MLSSLSGLTHGAMAAGSTISTPQAHGIGGSKDLPIPPALAIAGAAGALQVSFTVLALAWRTPRFDAALQGRPVPWLQRMVDSAPWHVLLRGVGLVFAAYVGWAALAGPDLVVNPTFGVVYVWLWVGLVPASLLFGPVVHSLSPLRTLHLLLCRGLGRDPAASLRQLPGWVGCWPGAVGLFAFTWLELASPDSTSLHALQLWFAGYATALGAGAVLFGQRWFAAADPFEVYSSLIAHLSVFGRVSDGRLVVRGPLRNLDGVPVRPGLTAVVTVLFGSTVFDSFRDSADWARFLATTGWDHTVVNTLGLLGFWGVTAGLFVAATMATPALPGISRRSLPNLFAHAVVPIVVGYITAHYLSFFVVVGQQTLIQLSDPMGTGADLLGTAQLSPSFWLILHPTLLASVKVSAIVGGHILGVIASHDRAIQVLPRRDQLLGQLPLLAVMVTYTCAGLYLLFGT